MKVGHRKMHVSIKNVPAGWCGCRSRRWKLRSPAVQGLGKRRVTHYVPKIRSGCLENQGWRTTQNEMFTAHEISQFTYGTFPKNCILQVFHVFLHFFHFFGNSTIRLHLSKDTRRMMYHYFRVEMAILG